MVREPRSRNQSIDTNSPRVNGGMTSQEWKHLQALRTLPKAQRAHALRMVAQVKSAIGGTVVGVKIRGRKS